MADMNELLVKELVKKVVKELDFDPKEIAASLQPNLSELLEKEIMHQLKESIQDGYLSDIIHEIYLSSDELYSAINKVAVATVLQALPKVGGKK